MGRPQRRGSQPRRATPSAARRWRPVGGARRASGRPPTTRARSSTSSDRRDAARANVTSHRLRKQARMPHAPPDRPGRVDRTRRLAEPDRRSRRRCISQPASAPARESSEFTLRRVLRVLAGGAAIALGPGQLILSLVPRPDAEDRAMCSRSSPAWRMLAGAGRAVAAPRAACRTASCRRSGGGQVECVLGATITAVELPTAFPVLRRDRRDRRRRDSVRCVRCSCCVLFNVCFVLPLIGIVATLMFAGQQSRSDAVGSDGTSSSATGRSCSPG